MAQSGNLSQIIHLFKVLTSLQLGWATNFSANDKFNPNAYAACLHRDIVDQDLVVAHRSLPCNSRVLIYAPRTGRSVWARIGDRGPKTAKVDLNVATTRALMANGMEFVVLMPEIRYSSIDANKRIRGR